MKQILALAFAGALSAIVAACGGGGTRVEPPPVTHYAGVADVLESGCPYAVGAVVPGHTSASSAQSAALSRCTAEATRQAAGAARVRSCQATSIRQCVAIAAGIDNARDCQVSTRSASSLSSARSSALQACRSALGSGADCEVLASGCASSSSPSVGVWRPPPPPIINGRPETVGGIPSQTVEEGSSETVSVSSYFTDPDRDSLTYASRSSDTGIVAVSLSGNTVTLRGVSAGTATVRVTATDPDGASAYQDFAVEVVEAFGGVNLGQVGDEFGNSSTTGRTNLNLTCTDDVVFEDEGQVVLPSVDVVALPSQAGTVTLEYEAYQIPDRFVVQVGGRVEIDTQYVGTSRSVAQINAVLTRYGFMPTSQASIISPGRGTRTFQKAAGVTSAVVRVYAPLTGTEWKVTLKFSGSSCQRNGNGSGLNPGEVGNEFGTTPTTGRTNLNLTCTDDVAFSDSGNVVLPSVDVVALPSEAGTVTLEYEAFQVPDRFVVVMGGRTIDTQYVGTSRSVAEVNAVLNRYGFIPTSQASIISPGNGTRSLQKPAGVTSAVVRVYAPLTGTQWQVTLKFAGSSCQTGPGPGTGTEDHLDDVNVTIPSSCRQEVEVCVRDVSCEDDDRLRVTLNGNVVFSGTLLNEWQCNTVPVRAGNNTFEVYTLNIGDANLIRACGGDPALNQNSGALRIRAGSDSRQQSWSLPGQANSSARMNVTIGPPGGTCTPGTGLGGGTQRRFGAIASSVEPQCRGKFAGLATRGSQVDARSGASANCRSAGGTQCRFHADFGNAYQGNIDCGAIAYGTRTSGSRTFCNLYVGLGNTESAAESDALSECRSEMTSCSIEQATGGGRFARCAR